MKGKDGKTLEERVMEIFGKIEEARKESDNIREEIRNIEKKIKKYKNALI